MNALGNDVKLSRRAFVIKESWEMVAAGGINEMPN